MKRAFIMVLDSFGIGATEDADRFGDVGADTLGHIAEACAKGEADHGRKGPLNLPNLTRLGLVKAHEGSTGKIAAGMDGNAEVIGAYAWAHELSSGKDTPSGHWEIAGVPVLFDWGYFSDQENSFPQELLDKLVKRANLPGYLGNCHSSGTVILDQLGEEHMKTGKPIFYTSARGGYIPFAMLVCTKTCGNGCVSRYRVRKSTFICRKVVRQCYIFGSRSGNRSTCCSSAFT